MWCKYLGAFSFQSVSFIHHSICRCLPEQLHVQSDAKSFVLVHAD